MNDPVLIGVWAAGLAWASWSDARTGRIPNVLTFGMMAAGLLLHAAGGDPLFALLGIGVAFAMHYPLYMLQIEKAGDAKLVMGVGALVGWREAIDTTLWFAVLYLPVGIAVLAARGRLGNLQRVFQWRVDKARGLEAGDAPEATVLWTAPVIAAAAIAARAFDVMPIPGP
ncbi:MAG: prepilin peptidase [Deltaproteobacteria bacterium]|nr:prepilin peptidase [Deltaproteobacteria bacterium]